MTVRLRPLVATAAAAAVVASVVAAAPSAAGTAPSPAPVAAPAPATTSYIVTLAPGSVPGEVARFAAGLVGGKVSHVYTTALQGFAITLPTALAPLLDTLVGVTGIERDGVATVSGTQRSLPSTGLDRIDQRTLPLSGSYTYPRGGTGVDAYVIDTGIRLSHKDFNGRAVSGIDLVNGGPVEDCNGHGTHVAGTLGGRHFGVAKNVRLIGVRVLGCNGSGANSAVIAGVDWVTKHHQRSRPAVANMSLGTTSSAAVDKAVTNSLLDGITYAVAAGNDSTEFNPGLLGLFPSGGTVSACDSSPARVPAALTVGAVDRDDRRAVFSDVGRCVDLFAPGTAIRSTWFESDTSSAVLSGTSMATPHVAGVAALYLQKVPRATPVQVAARLLFVSTKGVVKDAGGGSPNRLLYISAGV